MKNKVTLGSISTMKTGPFGTQLSASEYTKAGTPVINVRNIGYGEIITDKLEYVGDNTKKRLAEHIIKSGDIVFGRKGSVDRHAHIDERYDGWMQGSDCIRVRLSRGINNRFVSHFLKLSYVKKQINNASVGSTMDSLNTDVLKSIKIILPTIEIQNNLEKILSALESKIALNKRINAELETMAKTIYDYWFMQFNFPDENGNPYRSSGGAMEWNEQLKRDIPRGWNAEKIGSLLAKVPNTSRVQTDGYNKVGSIPVIDQSTDFIAGYTDEKEAVISANEGAIVFGDHTRIVKYIGFDFARGADGTQVLLSNNKRMPQILFYYSILKIDLSNYGYARHFKFLKDTFIILPNIEQVKAFHAAISPIQKAITHNIKENVELTALRDWLLPMLMNGQVTVK
ncbi:MAG: restriction endonuclease subunit S [Eubacteriales bacterium]